MKTHACQSILTTAVAIAALYSSAAAATADQASKSGVKVTVSKNVDFSRFSTYSWMPSQPSPLKEADDRIMAAVDRELRALGLTKADTGKGDVLVTYSALRRPDANRKAAGGQAMRPEDAVGTIVVGLLDPSSRERLLQLRAEEPLEVGAGGLDAAIDGVVSKLFTAYPDRARAVASR